MMKPFYFFIFLIGFITCAQAQIEFSNKFKAIPPTNIKPKPEKKYIPPTDPNVPLIIPPNVYKSPNVIQSAPNPVDDYKVKTESEISMIPKNEFINPGDEVRDRLNKSINKTLVNNGLKENDSYIRKTDIDFGVIYTKSEYIIIKTRDFGAIDGDLISIYITHDYKIETFANRLSLERYFIDVKVQLKLGISFLDIKALNRGALGGNTGEFIIYDDKGKILISNYWDNIDANVKSRFKIIRE